MNFNLSKFAIENDMMKFTRNESVVDCYYY